MRALLLLPFLMTPAVAGAAAPDAVPCNLEEVSADQQMFCVPSLVYDEEGEVIGGSVAGQS